MLRQGPHQAAQKSTSTGSFEASTSLWKLSSVKVTMSALAILFAPSTRWGHPIGCPLHDPWDTQIGVPYTICRSAGCPSITLHLPARAGISRWEAALALR